MCSKNEWVEGNGNNCNLQSIYLYIFFLTHLTYHSKHKCIQEKNK